MKKTILALAAISAAFALSTAQAQPAPAPSQAPRGEFPLGPQGPQRPEFKSLTHQEFMEHAEAHFKAMDANGDGLVSKEEMHKFYKERKEKRGHAGRPGADHAEGFGQEGPRPSTGRPDGQPR